jgi:DNA modification methylase
MNHLYFGDSLDILKQLSRQHPDGFIDLVYIDPPFNSKRNYNVLFETVDLHDAKAQKEAFADTWSNVSYKDTIEELKLTHLNLHKFLDALDHVGISQSAVSYLTTMAIRIFYIHKVLKPTGSFYLHCDPTMSHYLKLVCDLIFGEKNYRNEIIWKRYGAHNDSSQGTTHFGRTHDVILFYSKEFNNAKWQQVFTELDPEYVESTYRYIEEGTGKRFRTTPLTGPGGAEKGNPVYEWKGHTRAWRYNKDKMEQLDKAGKLYYSKTGYVSQKLYLDESKGTPVQDIWSDIKSLTGSNAERLGYPTQKPEALLERIIQASSNEGDVVADFFCGCGTTIAAAQRLNRKWIGVDISHLAVGLIRKRLLDTYGEPIIKTFTVDGLPKDIGSARALALAPQGRMHFQDWVIETLLGGVANEKKTGDGGYDGYTTLEVDKGKKEIVLIEVKSGNVGITQLRSFAKTVQQQKAAAGVFVCFADQITKGMRSEMKGEGYFRQDIFGTQYDRIQILSVEDLLDGKQPNLPRSSEAGPFKKAERATTKKSKDQGKLEF